ncbi:uncharacterized protein TNCV_173431 [Trichonephila clavipes]|nr:uncharacterized protein TNCV_173431 [Trichonephila clavipes]
MDVSKCIVPSRHGCTLNNRRNSRPLVRLVEDIVIAEIRERFQQLQNLEQKYAFLRPEVISSMDKLNLEQVPQHINKEVFQLERVRLQAFVAATDPGCKKELIRSLGLLKYIIQAKKMAYQTLS